MIYPIEYLLDQIRRLWSKIASVEGNTEVDFVHKAGDTMTGPLILSEEPTEDLQAATKLYVDEQNAAESLVFTFNSPINPWPLQHNKGRKPSSCRTLVRLPTTPTQLNQTFGQVIDIDDNTTVVTFGANHEGEAHLIFPPE